MAQPDSGIIAPDKVDPHNDRSASQWNGKGTFSENADSIAAAVPRQRIQRQKYSRGF
jgi:hypothetical protein